MGAWEELDVKVEIEFDTNDIDNAIEICDEYFTEDVKEQLETLKNVYDTAGKKASKDIATRVRSFQQQFITDLDEHPYASGMLGSSITEEQEDDTTWIIGTRINHIYPMAVEYGRKEIVPINAKVLFFYALSGEPVFTTRVGPAEPRPYVQPAYEKADAIADELVIRYIGRSFPD